MTVLFQVRHNTSYTTSSPSSSVNSRGTMDQSFTFSETSLNLSTSSLKVEQNEADNSLNTSMASLNIQAGSQDTTDGSVELPEEVDVVYVDGDDKKLCLATVSHEGNKITGCGHGNNKESAKQNAMDNLMSNFKILCTPFKI